MFERLCFKTGKFEAVIPFEQTRRLPASFHPRCEGTDYVVGDMRLRSLWP